MTMASRLFIGIDLGWYGTRITAVSEIRSWIARNAGLGTRVIAVLEDQIDAVLCAYIAAHW